MSREHTRPRSDYITAFALARSHAEHQSDSHPRPKHDVPKHLKPSMIIPDLRFEPTYLAKLAAAGPGWQSVVWVTIRDQVISPLLQGALWYVRRLQLTIIPGDLRDRTCHAGAPRPCSSSLCYAPSSGYALNAIHYSPQKKVVPRAGYDTGLVLSFPLMRG